MNTDFITDLRDFVNTEYDTQRRQIYDNWRQPINSRVAEGEAIADVEVVQATWNSVILRCEDNISKFRQADALLLNRGDPTQGGYSCSVEVDRGTELTISPGFGANFNGLTPSSGWALDRAIVDVRHIQLGVLDTVSFEHKLESYFSRLLNGQIRPQLDPSRMQAASNLAKKLGLNTSQQEAFTSAYGTRNYYLVQGPPGTGKTWVLAHLAATLAREGQRVLVTAFTHRSINNALRKVAQATGYKHVIKVGQKNYASDLTWDKGYVPNYEKFEYSPYGPSSQGIIVGGTCFAVRTSRLGGIQFDTVIFDEAGQMTLPLAISGMLSGSKFIFIGDHMQMAPVIVGEHRQKWVTKSIFEMLFSHFPGTMLDITYRMNDEINEFPSKRFYNGKLIPSRDASKRRLRLKRKPNHYGQLLDPSQPDIFVEIRHSNRGMRSREEAEIAAGVVLEALECGVPPEEIAIVAPYRAQGRLIRQRLHDLASGSSIDGLEDIVVDTVERIQGQERDIIIVSLTTSDPAHAAQRAEFYFQPNRLNVAITRPRVKRIVIGSPLLFTAKPPVKHMSAWVDHFRALYEQSYIVKLG